MIDLRVFRLETLLYRLKLPLQHQVSQPGLLLQFMHSPIKVEEKLLFLTLQILELLQAHFILPLHILEDGVSLHDLTLGLSERAHNLVVLNLLLSQMLNLLASLLQGLHYLLVGLLLVELLLLFHSVLLTRVAQLVFQLLYDV